MRNSAKFSTLLQFLMTAVLAVGAGWFFYYYFYKVPADPYSPRTFYEELRLSDLKIDADVIKKVLTENESSLLHQMTVNAAFHRFILDPSTGGAFDQILAEYESGLWMIPPQKVWREVFTDHVSRWETARRNQRMQSDTPLQIRSSDPDKSVFALDFSHNFLTALLGKDLELIVEIPSPAITTERVVYQWIGTIDNNEIRSMPRLTYWSEPESDGNKTIASLHINLAIDPLWYNPDLAVKHIIVSGPNTEQWQLQEIRLADRTLKKPALH